MVIVPDLAATGHGGGLPVARWDRGLGCVARPPVEDGAGRISRFRLEIVAGTSRPGGMAGRPAPLSTSPAHGRRTISSCRRRCRRTTSRPGRGCRRWPAASTGRQAAASRRTWRDRGGPSCRCIVAGSRRRPPRPGCRGNAPRGAAAARRPGRGVRRRATVARRRRVRQRTVGQGEGVGGRADCAVGNGALGLRGGGRVEAAAGSFRGGSGRRDGSGDNPEPLCRLGNAPPSRRGGRPFA